MNLESLLEKGKLKYDSEIQQRIQKERIAYRKGEVNTVLFNFIHKNMSTIESFKVVYPSLKVKLHGDGRLSVEKYSDKDYSGIAWLDWEFRNDEFDIVFYSSIGCPKKNSSYNVYEWEKDDLSEVPYDATDDEILQCANSSLVAMLQKYLEI